MIRTGIYMLMLALVVATLLVWIAAMRGAAKPAPRLEDINVATC